MKYMFLLLLVNFSACMEQKQSESMIIRREVLARNKTGNLTCSVLYDDTTKTYIGLLLNNGFYPEEKWAYKRLSQADAKDYYALFSPHKRVLIDTNGVAHGRR